MKFDKMAKLVLLISLTLLSACSRKDVGKKISDTAIGENPVHALFMKVVCIDPGNKFDFCKHEKKLTG